MPDQQMSISFHNTSALEARRLQEAELKANTQEWLIYEWIKYCYFEGQWTEFTPSFLHSELISNEQISAKTPLTSIRRSMSNLTKRGLLEKTGAQIEGPLGKPEKLWRLAL